MDFTHMELYSKWRESGGGITLSNMNALTQYVCAEMQEPDSGSLADSVRAFGYRLHSRWHCSTRNAARFERANRPWLKRTVHFTSGEGKTAKADTGQGRPKQGSLESSDRSKIRKVEKLGQTCSAQELAFAAAMQFRREGHEDAAKVIHEVPVTPTTASGLRQLPKKPTAVRNHTPEEALAIYIDINCSQSQYQQLKNSATERGAPNFYPSYKTVKEEMDKCIPENMSVTESVAQVPLQSLLDHSAKRLILHQDEVLTAVLAKKNVTGGNFDVLLVGKYGFDGSSGHANYNQNFEDTSLDDSSIFMSSYVPLKLSPQDSDEIIWYNIKASSPHHCRPIRIRFAKETRELTVKEKAQLDAEIAALQPTIIQKDNVTVRVTHSLSCSMIDGKVCSALTGISVQRCVVCGAFPRDFHNLPLLQSLPLSVDVFDFGVSPLHFGIRAMEALLHISYRIDFKRTAAKTKLDKTLMRFRKGIVQEDFKRELGLNVDAVRQGSGTSNDGNTARRFFENPVKTSELLRIDADLVTRIAVIYKAMNSGFFINVEKFRKYGLETYEVYLKNYNWYKIPPTLHKIFLHGAEIIDHCQKKGLTISDFSEEAQETRNKDLKKFREDRARKASRVQTNADVFRRMQVTSDMRISSLRRSRPPARKKGLPAEVLALLCDTPE